MTPKKVKILFLKNIDRPFIENDLKILTKYFEVKVVHSSFKKESIRSNIQCIYNIFKGVIWADVTYSWFADYHAFFANVFLKIFRKKSIIVIGGFEVAKVPEIEYGSMLYPRSARRVKYLLNNTNKLLAVSEFNKKEILKYTDSKNICLVYNGVDYTKLNPKNKIKNLSSIKNDIVITVCGIDKYTVKRKGLETFIKSAKELPEVRFIVIGKWMDNSIDYLRSIATNNVEFTGFVSENELTEWYLKAKVYCQLSLYESFGMALAESMCFECVPVVSNNAALPEVVGNVGFLVPYGDEEATAEAIKKALKSNKGKEARERIKNTFSLDRRENELLKVIKEVIDDEL
ncbi:hypothetical protein MSLAZ_3000 [Methanosarcina lacustris Z-7289]|uniref:Glycosyl transferase family 1 domain-containing protein n=1 Tax=Methanosarcina lacustris Z-7289 TaxID=1434111 RepID=A0A0E3S6W0_9EURY|nr:glycosyltransferase family 4 protein [Methanosarcina lacustris]AKB76261.1 hypothetical protein MSLAZ_3000 [Methanosarcina lacustris Z-7289]